MVFGPSSGRVYQEGIFRENFSSEAFFMSLDLLVAAASIAAAEPDPGLPPDRLRLTLEYRSPPDCT
ncbi:hypothetical protein LZ189_26555, partial [Rhodovulum sulfidophilum]|nr:hypothetical protein [Rhodovulum sulfidophilum]